jgi:capsular polysaccharide biosynthesis protein
MTSVPDFGQRPIAIAAAATTCFEATRIHQAAGTIRLGDELLQHLHQHVGLTFETIRLTTTVRNYVIENVVLDADTLVLVQDGQPIPETVYFLPSEKGRRPSVQHDALIRLPYDQDVIVGYNNAHQGYQHWLTQCLPAIDWSLRQQRNNPVCLLLPKLAPWQEDFIRLLDYESVPRLTPQPGARYAVPRIEYSEFLNGSTSFNICLSGIATARRILNAVPDASSPYRILYVRCTNPYYGSIENAEDVEALLKRHGAYIVDWRLIETSARINLFRHADLVIGPFGEGLTDILFSRAGSVLWEWMPRHHQNASINRLAQAAGIEYWGDLFESTTSGAASNWRIDLQKAEERLSGFLRGTAGLASGSGPATDEAEALPLGLSIETGGGGRPLNELLLGFESLGDNCDFGFVQRYAGVEPLGLLRFAAIAVPEDKRLERLVAALESKFDGLGAPGTVSVFLTGELGRRKYMARESVYNLQYHTGVSEGEMTPEELGQREIKRLGFLRRKFIEDLEAGEKIWVWKSTATREADQAKPLLAVLRVLGPNTLLWVVEADETHRPGTVEALEGDLLKGYVERNASYITDLEVSAYSWVETCQSAYALREKLAGGLSLRRDFDTVSVLHGASESGLYGHQTLGAVADPTPATQASETKPSSSESPRAGWDNPLTLATDAAVAGRHIGRATSSAIDQMSPEPAAAAPAQPPRVLSAMDYLRQPRTDKPAIPACTTPAPPTKMSWLRKLVSRQE